MMEKLCDDLWAQLTIFDAILGNYSRPAKGSGRYG